MAVILFNIFHQRIEIGIIKSQQSYTLTKIKLELILFQIKFSKFIIESIVARFCESNVRFIIGTLIMIVLFRNLLLDSGQIFLTKISYYNNKCKNFFHVYFGFDN